MSRAMSKTCAINLQLVVATKTNLSQNGMDWLETKYMYVFRNQQIILTSEKN